MKTARIITADRGRTRKYSAAVGTCTYALRPRCSENENCEGKHGVRFMGKNRAERVTAWNELDAEEGDLRGRGI